MVCLPILGFVLGAENKNEDVAASLIAGAHKISDIRSEGSPRFRLRASLRTLNAKGKPVDGTYVLIWSSPTQWREEIAFLRLS